jgi:hypothetical protein
MLATTMRRLMIPGTLAAIGAAVWFIGSGRRDPARDIAWAPLWPRSDGSVRSFGEVWDHPQLRGHDAT